MKRILSLFLALLMCMTVGVALASCGEDPHTHSYEEEWRHDETSHWRVATCCGDVIADKANHSFGEIVVDVAPTPTKKGSGHHTCSVCNLTFYNIEVEYTYDADEDVTLIFDVRGGEAIEPLTVKAGTTVDLTQYTVTRTDGATAEFEGWMVGGAKVESFVIVGDTVAHAAYSCDEYMGKTNIQLGRYPQTLVTDQTLIDALSQIESINSNGYIEYQGEEYAKCPCTFDSSFGYEKWTLYYFKVEPITWENVGGKWTPTRVIDFVYDSDTLDFLNGTFYDSLTEKEKAFIKDTKLNNDEPYKFYLWNVDVFASTHSDKKLPLTDYALVRDDTSNYKEDRYTTMYWLLNPVNGTTDVVSYYTFTSSNWQSDVTYMGKCGLLPCFNFDFMGIKKMTGDDTFRVTFNSNGGSEISTVTLIADEKYELAIPEKEGFDFAGWYKDEALTQQVSARDFSDDEDITLYAKWTEVIPEPEVYSINYVLNGGAFGSEYVYQYTEDTVVTFSTPTKASTISYNYKFDGWYLESDFTTKVTTNAGMPNDDITLYAKWIEEGIYFYINYELNGGVIVEDDYPNPTKVLRAEGSIDLPTVKKDGFIFRGWKERGHTDIITSISTNRTSPVTVEAYYIRSYEFTLDLAGGTLENEADFPTVLYENAPTIDFTQFVPKKEGFKFLYWTISWMSSGSNKYGVGHTETLSFTDGFNLPWSDSDPVIRAVFTPSYKLTVNAMGGSFDGGEDQLVIEFGMSEGYVTFETPAKDGANIIGWASDDYCGSEATWSDLYGTHKYFTVNNDGTTTFYSRDLFGYNSATGTNDILRFDSIYAIWDKVTVTFESNMPGATLDPIVIDRCTGFDLTASDYTFEITNDKKFGGWYYDEALTRKCSDSSYFYKDATVYGKWLSKLTITLVFEDGSTEDQYIFEGETIDSIKYRVGDGQYLGGVYFDEALTNKLTYSQTYNYKPTGDITLYVVRKTV